MPEIAEVALTAEILKKYLHNQILVSFDFVSGRYTKTDPVGYQDFVKSLPMKVKNIDSRGKFMWFELINPKNKNVHWYIWNTFGLTGMWSFYQAKHVRAVLSFENKLMAYFSDMRNFGTFKFTTDKTALEKKLEELSPDFLKDNHFSLDKIRNYDIPVVKILIDQKKVGSGLGNYLVAEILYRAHLSPHRLGSSLTKEEIKNLEYWIKYVVKLSYVDNYIGYMENLDEEARKIGRKNYHPNIKLAEKTFQFQVYRKKEDPYGNPVKAEKIVGPEGAMRTTYWVPAVQT